MFKDLYTEVESRIDHLNVVQQAYLSKGLMNLKHLLEPSNKELERALKNKMVDRCL
jgi:hypothetical protein